MEVLTFAGVEAVLFFDVPTESRLARFPEARAIGIAGIARSQSPAWMERELPPVFRALAALDAPVTQYKICSTFDSSPETGSIGKAIELGLPILGGAFVPLLTAAPAIHRYQSFGNLFATVTGSPYRLDRHPTMSRHPVTPMDEADLGVHLARQTRLPVGLVDLVAMKAGRAAERLAEERARGARIVSLDVVDDETLRICGQLMWEARAGRLFAVGSQGVEYALIAYWRAAGTHAGGGAGTPCGTRRSHGRRFGIVLAGHGRPDRLGRGPWLRRDRRRRGPGGRRSRLVGGAGADDRRRARGALGRTRSHPLHRRGRR